jgi:DNA topoisomerase-2
MPVKKNAAAIAVAAAPAPVVPTPGPAGTVDKKVEDKYKKYELLEHILALPDTYIGSIEPQKITSYIYDEPTKHMVTDELTYIPGLLKIFDEVIVNAIDHSMRLKADEAKGKEDIKHVKNIKVTIDKETGRITILNDGNGVDIKKHSIIVARYDEVISEKAPKHAINELRAEI